MGKMSIYGSHEEWQNAFELAVAAGGRSGTANVFFKDGHDLGDLEGLEDLS